MTSGTLAKHRATVALRLQALVIHYSVQSAFAENQAKRQLMEHVDAKHPKMTFPECFPGYEEEEA